MITRIPDDETKNCFFFGFLGETEFRIKIHFHPCHCVVALGNRSSGWWNSTRFAISKILWTQNSNRYWGGFFSPVAFNLKSLNRWRSRLATNIFCFMAPDESIEFRCLHSCRNQDNFEPLVLSIIMYNNYDWLCWCVMAFHHRQPTQCKKAKAKVCTLFIFHFSPDVIMGIEHKAFLARTTSLFWLCVLKYVSCQLPSNILPLAYVPPDI